MKEATRLLIAALALCFLPTLPAMAAPVEETLAAWQRVQDPDSGADFAEISAFISEHGHWPDQNKIRIRAERAMRGASISDGEIISWFERFPPISGVGKWTYAEALNRGKADAGKVQALVKEAWRDADLTEDEENSLLREFGELLTTADHKARIERLLWEGKATPALHLIPRMSAKEQVMYEARASLIQDSKNANYLVSQVSPALKHDPGLLFDRLRFRLRKNDTPGVREILMMTPTDIPEPQRWWKIREAEIRRAIDEGNYKMAARLLSNHGQTGGAPLADALWLQGWIELEFLHHPKEAYQRFYRMYDSVRTPVSKARAAYWAARAADKSGDTATAANWYATAANHPTAFYGQLAVAELSESPVLSLPNEPTESLFGDSSSVPADIKEAIRLCIKNGENKLASRLINFVIENAEKDVDVLAVAALGHELSAPHISVKAAKKAQQQGIVLQRIGYPTPKTDSDLPIERPLTLAITRQESEFDPKAESPAGALGMMQLLPGTAKETAGKIDVAYSRNLLDEPEYNFRLGSHYLSRLINAQEGSYVLAIASYNAGPGNVRKWMQQFGTPGSDVHSAINWIEKIPFAETRNYVQRVLENLQVYRALEGDTKLAIKEDLVR